MLGLAVECRRAHVARRVRRLRAPVAGGRSHALAARGPSRWARRDRSERRAAPPQPASKTDASPAARAVADADVGRRRSGGDIRAVMLVACLLAPPCCLCSLCNKFARLTSHELQTRGATTALCPARTYRVCCSCLPARPAQPGHRPRSASARVSSRVKLSTAPINSSACPLAPASALRPPWTSPALTMARCEPSTLDLRACKLAQAPASPTEARIACSRTSGSPLAPQRETSCPCSSSFTGDRGSLARRSRTTARRSPRSTMSFTPPSPTAPGPSGSWPSRRTRPRGRRLATGACSTCSRACAGCSARWGPSAATRSASPFTASVRAPPPLPLKPPTTLRP